MSSMNNKNKSGPSHYRGTPEAAGGSPAIQPSDSTNCSLDDRYERNQFVVVGFLNKASILSNDETLYRKLLLNLRILSLFDHDYLWFGKDHALFQ